MLLDGEADGTIVLSRPPNAVAPSVVERGGLAASCEVDVALDRELAPVVCYVERCEVDGAVLSLGGWVFSRSGTITAATIVFEAEGYVDRVAALCGLARPDVGERLGSAAASSGFTASGLVLLEAGSLFLDVRSDDGAWHRQKLGTFRAHPQNGAPLWVADEGDGAKPDSESAWAGDLQPGLTFSRLPASRYAARTLRELPKTPPCPPSAGPRRPVSILAAIYQGAAFLDAFFTSLRERTEGHDEIILVDNGNADPALAARIAEEAARVPRCRVLRLDVNRGYIIGIGAAFAARMVHGHVVVLNSDVELPCGWLARLLWPLDNLPRVASATPFTNAGTSCSFPVMGVDNPVFLGLDVLTIDRSFQAIDPRRTVVALPSGVGFCMAMHADAIAAVGWFDATTFGLGYGEENDWCLRARALGWRDLLVPNLFVYHKHGGVYAADTKRALLRRNLDVIDRLHPGYFGAVSTYFRADQAGAARAIIGFQLAREASGRQGRALTFQVGDDPLEVAMALASDEPSVIALFDEDRRTWSALLSASGFRAQLWGWGTDEFSALQVAVGLAESSEMSCGTLDAAA